jgi:catechol 2,3-dioxygenase-like lactoylglutathione lyase family enzyme
MTADGPRIARLQHVSLPFPGTPASLDAARRFYGELLGLAECPRPPLLPGVGIWYTVGDQELHLFSEPGGVAVNTQWRRHPCFQVDEVAALRQRLDAAGVTTRDDDGEIPGRLRFFAVDPFENTLELVQFEAKHW